MGLKDIPYIGFIFEMMESLSERGWNEGWHIMAFAGMGLFLLFLVLSIIF